MHLIRTLKSESKPTKWGKESRSEHHTLFLTHARGSGDGVGGWMDGWIDGWVDGWMDRWVDGWVGGWVDGWMDEGWLDGWMGWVENQTGKQMNGILVRL